MTVHYALPRVYWTELLNMFDFKLESQEATRRRSLITINEERLNCRERNFTSCSLVVVLRSSSTSRTAWRFSSVRIVVHLQKQTCVCLHTVFWSGADWATVVLSSVVTLANGILNNSADPLTFWDIFDVFVACTRYIVPKSDTYAYMGHSTFMSFHSSRNLRHVFALKIYLSPSCRLMPVILSGYLRHNFLA